MAFDFQSTEAWETSTDTMLGRGNHLVTIVESDPGWTKDHSKPELDLKVENGDGAMRDWIQITPNTIGKVVQVFKAAGIDPPKEGEFNPSTGELTEACCARLRGKKVGVVIRPEPDTRMNATLGAERDRIKGYVTVDRVSGAAAAGGSSQDFAGVGSSQDPGDPDIPF